MKTLTTTEHALQICRPKMSWSPVFGYPFNDAIQLAEQGQFERAIISAEESQRRHCQHMNGSQFRVVTTSKTITVLGGDIEEHFTLTEPHFLIACQCKNAAEMLMWAQEVEANPAEMAAWGRAQRGELLC